MFSFAFSLHVFSEHLISVFVGFFFLCERAVMNYHPSGLRRKSKENFSYAAVASKFKFLNLKYENPRAKLRTNIFENIPSGKLPSCDSEPFLPSLRILIINQQSLLDLVKRLAHPHHPEIARLSCTCKESHVYPILSSGTRRSTDDDGPWLEAAKFPHLVNVQGVYCDAQFAVTEAYFTADELPLVKDNFSVTTKCSFSVYSLELRCKMGPMPMSISL